MLTRSESAGAAGLASTVPGLAHHAILFNPSSGVTADAEEQVVSRIEQSAAMVGIQTLRLAIRSTDEFESAFAQARASSTTSSSGSSTATMPSGARARHGSG